jgi:hypothetical protein
MRRSHNRSNLPVIGGDYASQNTLNIYFYILDYGSVMQCAVCTDCFFGVDQAKLFCPTVIGYGWLPGLDRVLRVPPEAKYIDDLIFRCAQVSLMRAFYSLRESIVMTLLRAFQLGYETAANV